MNMILETEDRIENDLNFITITSRITLTSNLMTNMSLEFPAASHTSIKGLIVDDAMKSGMK